MASLDDIFTTAKNIVLALNGAAQNALDLSGQRNSLALTTTTVVSAKPGRVIVVSVVVAGTGDGTIYDASSIATAVSGRELAVIPQTVGPFTLAMPVAYGIVVAPGTGQTVTVSFT